MSYLFRKYGILIALAQIAFFSGIYLMKQGDRQQIESPDSAQQLTEGPSDEDMEKLEKQVIIQLNELKLKIKEMDKLKKKVKAQLKQIRRVRVKFKRNQIKMNQK